MQTLLQLQYESDGVHVDSSFERAVECGIEYVFLQKSNPALIIGSGNIARAAVYALKKMEWPSIVVLDASSASESAATPEDTAQAQDDERTEAIDQALQYVSGLTNPNILSTRFDIVIFASDTLPTRVSLSEKVIEAWRKEKTHPLSNGPLFFDTAGGAYKMHSVAGTGSLIGKCLCSCQV